MAGKQLTFPGTGVASGYVLPIATTADLGGIKPDGTTIVVNGQGVASAIGGSGNFPYTTVTTLTGAAVQTAINSVTSGGVIFLSAGNYAITAALTFGGKTNVTICGFGAANFITATLSELLLLNGNTYNCRFVGINFAHTGTRTGSSGGGLILINEQGTHNYLKIQQCTFTSPDYCQNAITSSTYSVQANGGNGVGKLLQNSLIDDCDFYGMGRCGIELVNHAWDDNKLDVYLKNNTVQNCRFNDLGRVNDGTAFNGMAFSNSGAAWDTTIVNCQIMDAKLLAIELAGSTRAVVAGNQIDYVNNTAVGISISDNQHKVTKDINLIGNIVRSKTRPFALNGITNFNLNGNTWINDTVESGTANSNACYFQNSIGGELTGGSITSGAANALRFDDSSEIVVGSLRITGTHTGNFSSISIFGTAGAAPNGSNNNKINSSSIIYRKSNGIATTGVVETFGNQTGNTTT
ncbi:MAG TPA: hypothetical protein VGB67_12705 [Fibrella sp.]|jgi:hypothetical protein